MHRVQRRSLKKRKDNSKRNGGKSGKNEGNITMSKHLTIPPEFFSSGFHATNKKTRKDTSELKENYSVLDSFHSLFNKCHIRRSDKILSLCTEGNTSADAPKYSNRDIDGLVNESLILNPLQETQSVELLNSQKENNYQNNNKGNNRKGNSTIKKSKSIFAEINQLYARSHSNNFSNLQIGPVNNSTKEFNSEYSFCNSLIQQINAAFKIEQKTILLCKSKICTEIKNIDKLLSGNTKMDKKSKGTNINSISIEEGSNDMNWMCFPQSEWIYNTPPRQKIIPPKFEDSQLQPAVLCTNQRQKQLFEWKPNLKISHFGNKDSIVVNDKYMEHTASFNRDINNANMDPSISGKKIRDDDNNMFNFPKRTLFKPYQTANVNYESSQATKVNKFENNDLDHQMFPHYRETEAKILENNRSPPILYYEARKRLFCQNPSTFNLVNDFQMDCSSSSNSDKKNHFPFLKSINNDATSELNFNFKGSSRITENGNMFHFAPDKKGFI